MTTYHQIYYENDEHVLVDMANKSKALGTARSINVADAGGTHTGTQASFDGTGDVTIRLPATIGADITGNAQTATTADTATSASTAQEATHAASADSATSAGHATTADSATTATSATTADSAATAGHATTADSATTATSASTAQEATHATSADSATAAATATTATSATKLATARTFRTNLASTSAPSFDGTANCTPGVSGVLPIANGGTGSSSKNFVDLTSAQSVAGIKTFTSDTIYAAKSTMARDPTGTAGHNTDTHVVVTDVNGADLLTITTTAAWPTVILRGFQLTCWRQDTTYFSLNVNLSDTTASIILNKTINGTTTSVTVATL